VPTSVGALVQFASGQSAQSTFSFESPLTRMGFVEITGTEATLSLPDPNHFGGDLRIRRAGDAEWTTAPATGSTAGRGVGVLEMARAIREGRPHRAQGELAFHVLDTMLAVSESIETGAFVDVASRIEPVPSLPEDWDPTASTLSGAVGSAA